MDPITAAAARVVGFLGPVALGKGVELAKKVGEDAVDKIADWLDGLRKRWADDPGAKEAVEEFVASPDDKEKEEALRDVLAQRMKDDPALENAAEKLASDVGPYVVVTMEAGEVRVQNGPKFGDVLRGTVEVHQSMDEGDTQTGPTFGDIG